MRGGLYWVGDIAQWRVERGGAVLGRAVVALCHVVLMLRRVVLVFYLCCLVLCRVVFWAAFGYRISGTSSGFCVGGAHHRKGLMAILQVLSRLASREATRMYHVYK